MNFDLILLFFSSFFSATIFPAQSEIILATINIANNHSKFSLLFVATFGNVLGSLTNWLIGFYLLKFKDKKWFLIKDQQIDKYSKIYQKFGIWSLLFAWLPVVGDPLTLIAGIFRVNIWLFLVLVTIGKMSRYLLIIFASSGV